MVFSLQSSEQLFEGMNHTEDKRSNNYRIRKDAIHKSTDVLLVLLKQAQGIHGSGQLPTIRQLVHFPKRNQKGAVTEASHHLHAQVSTQGLLRISGTKTNPEQVVCRRQEEAGPGQNSRLHHGRHRTVRKW